MPAVKVYKTNILPSSGVEANDVYFVKDGDAFLLRVRNKDNTAWNSLKVEETDPIWTAEKPRYFKSFDYAFPGDAGVGAYFNALDFGTQAFGTESTGGIVSTFKDKTTVNWGYQLRGDVFFNELYYRGQNGASSIPNNYQSWRTFAFQDWVTSQGYVLSSGSYSDPTWLTSLAWSKISGAPSTYTPSAHTHNASEINAGTLAYARLPVGTAASTVAAGNDSRINNGQTAFSWGNHSGLYVSLSGSYANPAWITSLAWSKLTEVPSTFTPSAHVHSGSDITSGTVAYARLPIGTTASTVAAGDDSRFHNAVTVGTANGLSLAGQALSLATASSTVTGALSAANWVTFNSKQSALSGTGILSFNGTAATYTSGTANQLLRRNAANTAYEFFTANYFSLPSLTSGSILFSNGTTITEDNANFFWSNTNKRIGIGTNAPIVPIHLVSSGEATVLLRSTDISNVSGLLIRNNSDVNVGFIQFGNSSSPVFANNLSIGTANSSIGVDFYQGGVDLANKRIQLPATGGVIINSLSGSGTRQVVAESNGVLSTVAMLKPMRQNFSIGSGSVTAFNLATFSFTMSGVTPDMPVSVTVQDGFHSNNLSIDVSIPSNDTVRIYVKNHTNATKSMPAITAMVLAWA